MIVAPCRRAGTLASAPELEWCKLAIPCDSTMPADSPDQRPVIRPVNYKGERCPDKRTHPKLRDHGLNRCNSTSQPSSPHKAGPSRSPSPSPPEQPHPTFPNNSDKDPVISYIIKALDLSVSRQHYLPARTTLPDALPFLRTHGSNDKEKNTKRTKKKYKNSRQTSKHSTKTITKNKTWALNNKTAATRENKKPKCKYGNRRKLDHPRDDVKGKVCWFHKSKRGEDRKDENCR